MKANKRIFWVALNFTLVLFHVPGELRANEKSPALVINEIVVTDTNGAEGSRKLFIEVETNIAPDYLAKNYYVELNGIRSYAISPSLGKNDGFLTFILEPKEDNFFSIKINKFKGNINKPIAQAIIPVFNYANEILVRYSGERSLMIAPREYQSLGQQNLVLPLLKKITGSTEFRPRDSSSNAILALNDEYFILGGWMNWAHDVWYSIAEVWKSSNGINWELINKSPPYSPYSSFVVLNGHMYAFAGISYKSKDGIEWTRLETEWGQNKRVLKLDDEIFGLIDSRVVRLIEGKNFSEIQSNVPWGPNRKEPVFISYDKKLWMIGGTTELSGNVIKYHNDVWSSSDGSNWHEILSQAPWEERRWHNGFVVSDKLFISNGFNANLWGPESGNVSDLWYTQDGSRWLELKLDHIWSPRHASFILQENGGKVLLSSGYGHGGPLRIYNDVWQVDFKMFFSKPEGALSDLGTWGDNVDGNGEPPQSFSMGNTIFVITNRSQIKTSDVSRQISHLAIGDGVNKMLVSEDAPLKNTKQYIQSNVEILHFNGNAQ